ncbi:permease prefix domain 1-containing protein [Microbacterium sp. NPDC077184]|uniref:permease prefix domain 1-containing protein n=1 Tax=Microbacterium sp. NPDC077184 TaxID=3154764 RepID=UPI00343C52B9
MTEVTLTDRYIDATVRSVPERQRDDLSAELRSSIADQIEARVEGGVDPAEAERAVLTALGDPDRLAAEYADRPAFLIGPRYFFSWWRLLKLLLAIVLPCAALGVALAQTLSGAAFGEIVGSVVVTLLQVTVHLGFWTVLVFALFERTVPRPADAGFGEWTLDRLPEPHQRGAGFGDMVGQLVFLALGVGLVLWDLAIGFVPSERGLSFLDPGLWPTWFIGLVVLAVAEAALTMVVYLAGRWTAALAVVNLVLNAAFVAVAGWLLAEGRLLNAAFFPAVIGDRGGDVAGILSVIFGFGIVVVAGWDTVDAFLKARRGRGGAMLAR